MRTKEEYIQLLKEVKKNFPSLKNKKIRIKVINRFVSWTCDASAMICSNFGFFPIVSINPRYAKLYTDFEMKGIIAHELGHLESDFEPKTIKGIIERIFYPIPSIKEKVEKATDMRAINRGFGKELLAYRIKRRKYPDNNLKKLERFYLTPEEIRGLI